jgi:CubicO group peptidase (beta-lactamase class C family)
MMRSLRFAVGAFLVAAAAAAAEAVDAAAIDSFVEGYLSRNSIPGASLVVTRGTELVLARGYGIAGPGRPMTADTPMVIGSQSKSFTALAVMQLVEAGKLGLDAPVSRYIPWFQVADAEASSLITIRSLLNHTSGLSESG